jgi:hypothetical protein
MESITVIDFEFQKVPSACENFFLHWQGAGQRTAA